MPLLGPRGEFIEQKLLSAAGTQSVPGTCLLKLFATVPVLATLATLMLTSVTFHASNTVSAGLDTVQACFVRELGLSDQEPF